eukprot:Em0003g459a
MACTVSLTQRPNMQEFYAGKQIFLTGATGFMGKCLLEKLLRSLHGLKRVIVLVRPKKEKTAKQRLDELLSSKAFDVLREEQPQVFEKVYPVVGDVSHVRLGLSEDDQAFLVENTDLVFHLAATIRFDAPLREALTLNVAGVLEVVRLCKRMKKLESFVHVSTAYAYCDRPSGDTIDEVVYPVVPSAEKLLELLEWMDDDQLKALTPSLLKNRPNTYTYTKALAEQLLVKECKGLPVAIFRPSIIGAALKEPHPGWIDCLHGPGGIYVAVGKGLLRVLKCQENNIADFIPVDYVNNMLVSVGWVTALQKPAQPIVYNCTTSNLNPISWIRMYGTVIKSYTERPFDQIYRRPWVVKSTPASAWKYWNFFLHYVPGFFADVLLWAMGKKPIMLKVYRKLEVAVECLSYFIEHGWVWKANNCLSLLSLMTEEDKETFYFDVRNLDWEQYVETFCAGTKYYLLKEDPANLPKARKQIKRLRNMRYTFNFIMFLLATRVLYLKSRVAREIWSYIMTVGLRLMAQFGVPLLHST